MTQDNELSLEVDSSLDTVMQTLFPATNIDIGSDTEILKHCETEPEKKLKGYYLFKVSEITVPLSEKEIATYISKRFQNILVSCYRTGLSVVTVFVGRSGTTSIYFGFKNVDGNVSKDFFRNIMMGTFPGIHINYEEGILLPELTKGMKYGGLINGIPVLEVNKKKTTFNISSVLRTMYGSNYTICFISNPVDRAEIGVAWNTISEIKDHCHSLAKRTRREGESSSVGSSHTDGVNQSKTITHGAMVGGGIILPFLMIGGGYNYSRGKTSGTSSSDTSTESLTTNRSISFEEQNSRAIFFEKQAEKYLDRLIKGINVGYWETSISLACEDQDAIHSLCGGLVAEYSNPSVDLSPPWFCIAKLPDDRTFLLPKRDSGNDLYPSLFSSYITGEELSRISSPTSESIPGCDVKRTPNLSLTDQKEKHDSIRIGSVSECKNPIEGSSFTLSISEFIKHLFVTGVTGCGKTNTVQQILLQAQRKWHEVRDDDSPSRIPFLVIESAKRDYRKLYGCDEFGNKGDLLVFTIGDANVSPIRFNLFYIQKHVNLGSHIDYLKATFNASFSLYGPMPYILEKCLYNVYENLGWDLTKGYHPFFLDDDDEYDISKYEHPEHKYVFPTLYDLKEEVDRYVREEMTYDSEISGNIRAAIVARLESLCIGAKGLMFNTREFDSIGDLLQKQVVFELEPLTDDDDKALFVGLMLTFITEYRQSVHETPLSKLKRIQPLKHLLIIEEAHRLLKNVNTERVSEMMGNPRGRAVDFFCNVIAEMRSLGQGIIVIEQIPTKIAPDVIKNTSTKIVHRLVSKSEQNALAAALGITEKDSLYLNQLSTGSALCFKEGMSLPVEVRIDKEIEDIPISNTSVRNRMIEFDYQVSSEEFRKDEIRQKLGEDGETTVFRFLNTLLSCSHDKLKEVNRICFEQLSNELKKQCINVHNYENSIKAYVVDTIMLLLMNGVFFSSLRELSGIHKSVESYILNGELESRNRILSLLNIDINAEENSRSKHTDILTELIKYFINKNGLVGLTKHELDRLISDYFIFDTLLTTEISERISKEYQYDN